MAVTLSVHIVFASRLPSSPHYTVPVRADKDIDQFQESAPALKYPYEQHGSHVRRRVSSLDGQTISRISGWRHLAEGDGHQTTLDYSKNPGADAMEPGR